jgi:hypothetical protein
MDSSNETMKKISIKAEEIGRKVALDIVSHCWDN